MARWLTRDYQDDDLESVVHLWESTSALGQASVFTVAECIGALRTHEPAVVAVSSGVVIGAALATIAGERAWVTRIAVDPRALAAATGGFTPADIEYAARVAAQTAFEREVVQGQETDERGASTDDYLAALAQVTPTVTAAVQAHFAEDIESFART